MTEESSCFLGLEVSPCLYSLLFQGIKSLFTALEQCIRMYTSPASLELIQAVLIRNVK